MPDINMQHFGELQRNQHSIDVEIDASQVASPQQDFSMMLETPNSSNSILNIIAINELGEQLPTEIEGIANDKNWVHLKDLVQSVANRKMKVFYGGGGGKPAVDSTYGKYNVYPQNHKIVHHFNTVPTGILLNSAGANHSMTNTAGSMTSDDLIDSPNGYGKAIAMDADDTLISSATVAGVGNEWTVITIHKPLTSGISHPFVFTETNVVPGQNLPNQISIISGRIDKLSSTRVCSPSAYIKLYDTTAAEEYGAVQFTLFTWDGTNLKIYHDNVEITSFTKHVDAAGTQTDSARMIRFEYNQEMIQARFINEVVSSGWMDTMYNNFNNPTATGNSPFYKSISKELNFAESLQSLGRAG